jgi:hypothetical protein
VVLGPVHERTDPRDEAIDPLATEIACRRPGQDAFHEE